MPIGAVIGGAVIGGGATILAGSKSAKAQKSAAQTASNTELQVAHENNALFRDIYNQNKGILAPYANAGLPATSMLNDLLYGTNTFNPAATAVPAGTATPAMGGAGATVGTPVGAGALTPFQQRTVDRFGTNEDLSYSGANGERQIGTMPGALMAYRANQLQQQQAAAGNTAPAGATTTPPPAAATGGGSPAGGALDAFARFREGTNYQWRFNEGQRALDSPAAAHGALDSGAQRQAEITFGQNFASNELANYMDLLARQQAVGLSAASAVAGVGNTYAGNVASSNTAAGNAAANAALAKGQATSNMWGSIAGVGGQLGGALFQYGLGQMGPQSPPMYPTVGF